MDYKRILTVQDISCLGQCSMTVALPILSACGHETCILPTAVLSTHTGGFSRPEVHHLGSSVEAIWRHWQREGICFDGIYTGYLGSVEAVETVCRLSRELLKEGGELIVDPAMADHGRLYSGLSREYADAMAQLCAQADILMPNLTEAAMLTGSDFQERPDEAAVRRLMEALPAKNVVLTGIGYREGETGIAILEGEKHSYYAHPKVPKNYHGTGDIFAACFVGMRLRGWPLHEAARIAADFTAGAIKATWNKPAHSYGVKFETMLPTLMEWLDQEESTL